MPFRIPTIELDHLHSTAVCQGVGERLRDALSREAPDLPQHLRTLIDRLPELDRENTPSVVPDADKMIGSR